MPDQSKSKNLLSAISALSRDGGAGPGKIPEAELDPILAALRLWQSQRLAGTYADFLAHDRYAPACRFFLSHIYAPEDFSRRDREFERLHTLLSRYLPKHMLYLLREGIDLNALSNTLDRQLLDVLDGALGANETITPELYAWGYRLSDNYDLRLEQIERLAEITREIGEGARRPLVGITLRLARGPAYRAGWVEVYEFLARGYRAFQPMRDVAPFVDAVRQRETCILDRIYSGENDPFRLVDCPEVGDS